MTDYLYSEAIRAAVCVLMWVAGFVTGLGVGGSWALRRGK